MSDTATLEIFVITLPGMEDALSVEACEMGFDVAGTTPGGVSLRGDWTEVWRANLALRGATRVLVRLGSFMAFHLAQLDKRARKFPWADTLRPDVPVRVDVATSRKSKIYHAGAATERIEKALTGSAGIAIATGCTLLLSLSPHALLPIGTDQRIMVLITTWGAVAVIWITLAVTSPSTSIQ